MAKRKDKKISEVDEAQCGSRTLRFKSIEGFAQRRPTEEKESKPDAADDNTGRASVVDGDGACADSSGHSANRPAR